MTNRPTPTPDTSAEMSAPIPTDPVRVALATLVAIPPADVNAENVTPVVRSLGARQRQTLVMAIATDPVATGHAVAIPLVMSAPTGADPRENVTTAIGDALESVAGLIAGCRERGTDDRTDDALADAFVAALSRVTPDVAAAEKAERAPRSATNTTRNRANITRDWSNAAGVYTTEKGNTIRVTLRGGEPTFHAVDPAGEKQTFTTPTPAQAWADGWTAQGLKRGWRNPFVSCRDKDGNTLGDRAPQVAATG